MTNEERKTRITQLSEVLFKDLQLTEHLSKTFAVYLLEELALFDRKHHDYGPGNIAAFGLLGVLVKMNDKVERLKNLMGRKRSRAKNESIRDSLLDIANYANIGLMVEKGEWPKS